MNPLMDSVLEDYCFALNLGFSESFVFCRGFFLYWKSIISKLTVLTKVVYVDLSYRNLEIIKLLFEFQS